MKVRLVDFFRNGDFGGVKIGFSQSEVESLLGKPDVFVFGIRERTDDHHDAGLWYYAGVQFLFDMDGDRCLIDIGFRPEYLHPECPYRDPINEKTVLDHWIFDPQQMLSVEILRDRLNAEAIPFIDTGLESCIFDETISNFRVVPYKANLDPDDSFGTIALKSGVQIRYLVDGSITRVAGHKDVWMIKGREQNIDWSNSSTD